LTKGTGMGIVQLPVIETSNLADTRYGVRVRTQLENLDSFGRKRVSQPVTDFDSKLVKDKQPLFWDEKITGLGATSTHEKGKARVRMTVDPEQNGKIIRQTRRWFSYQPGKSRLVKMTGVIGASLDNISVGIRSSTSGSAVDIKIPRSEWNYDKMDGSGPSGVTIDPNKSAIFFYDLEWLGVGTVAYGFFVDRTPYYVHFQHHANILDMVYMSNPNLPVRYEIESLDGTITKRMGQLTDDNGVFLEARGTEGITPSLDQICTTVITEGGRQNTGFPRTIRRSNAPLVTLSDSGIYPLIGIRLKSTDLEAFIKTISASVNCSSSATYDVIAITNPTIVGVAPTWVDLSNSAVQYCFPLNTTKLTGGTELYSENVVDTNQNVGGFNLSSEDDFSIGSDIDGVADTYFLAVQVLSGTTETFYGNLNITETN
jgi:hypothetical protein